MDDRTKSEIGMRLRNKREAAGYTREQLAEKCGLSPRFIANVEFGTSTFSLNSLITMCSVLSCSSDDLLFGNQKNADAWEDTTNKIKCLDIQYKDSVDKILQGFIEAISK